MPEDQGHNTKTDKTSQGGPASSTEDLKEREYRDKEGNIHHHTHTSKEEKKAS